MDVEPAETPDRLTRFALAWSQGRSLRFKSGVALAAIAVSTGLRFAVDSLLPAGFPFLTFIPAILLAAFFAGPRAAAAVAVATGGVSWAFFLEPGQPLAAARLAMLFFAFIAGTEIFLVHLMSTALGRMVRAEAQSSALARSRALMFHELQHRVSNNIATIGALLRLQERQLADPQARAALADARARLEVVARLQRRLCDPTRQAVEMAGFLEGLVADTLAAMDATRRITCVCDLHPMLADADRAMPLGLVAAELVMNACEHGFPGGAEGMIVIRLAPEPTAGLVRMAISDDGRGLPAGFPEGTAPSLGLSIARQFAEQLGGRLSIRPREEGGTEAELVFPLSPPEAPA